MAFGCSEPAPNYGGEQVTGYLFSGQVLYVVGLKLGFGVLQPYLEGVQLLGADGSDLPSNAVRPARFG